MIFTGRYQYMLSDLTHYALRTTRGAPRFKLPYTLNGAIKEITPPREALGLPKDEFREVYIKHLESVGIKRIQSLLQAEVQKSGGRPVVLMCFCGPQHEFCHRWMFAEWYESKTGVSIPELSV